MTGLVERKVLPFELKDATEQGIIRGDAAVIGNVDDGGDKILPGAFDRSIARSKGIVPIYWGHEWSRIPLGYGTEAAADQRSLKVAGELTMEIVGVKDAYASIAHAKRLGYKMGLSIGYRIPPKGWDMEGQIRLLKEVDVFEWSVTPFPMNKRAGVTALKSITEALDLESFTERDLEGYMREAFDLSAREAKTFISRLRVLLKSPQRDVSDDNELPAELKSLQDRISFDRWMAEQRSQFHIRG